MPAFGVTVHELARLQDSGCTLVDTTCGSVLNVWKNVTRYARDGFTADHPRQGQARGDAGDRVQALEDGGRPVPRGARRAEAEEVCAYIRGGGDRDAFLARFGNAVSRGFRSRPGSRPHRPGQPDDDADVRVARDRRDVRAAMVDRYGADALAGAIRAFDTICSATQERQDAVISLLDDEPLDLMLVVGGYNSSNTCNLARICADRVPTYHIADVDRLDLARPHPASPGAAVRPAAGQAAGDRDRRAGCRRLGPCRIGLTAGASTPEQHHRHGRRASGGRSTRRAGDFRDSAVNSSRAVAVPGGRGRCVHEHVGQRAAACLLALAHCAWAPSYRGNVGGGNALPSGGRTRSCKSRVGLTTARRPRSSGSSSPSGTSCGAEKAELEKQEAALSRLLTESNDDEAVVVRTIDRVEAARSALAKTRTLMLYRMHRLLSPDQRARLDAVRARAGQDGRSAATGPRPGRAIEGSGPVPERVGPPAGIGGSFVRLTVYLAAAVVAATAGLTSAPARAQSRSDRRVRSARRRTAAGSSPARPAAARAAAARRSVRRRVPDVPLEDRGSRGAWRSRRTSTSRSSG